MILRVLFIALNACLFITFFHAFIVSTEFQYLFLLNKNPLFEKSDPDLKRGGVINTRFLNSENSDFLPKNQQEKPEKGQIFSCGEAADFSLKKGGGY